MKLTLRLSALVLVFTLFTKSSFSQISIQSTKGYSVNVYVAPIELIVHGNSNSCTWGYNYDVELEYIITVTGNNAPKNLYTLQGTITNETGSLFFNLPKKAGTGTTRTNGRAWRAESDCGTATISTMNFKSIEITISGDGINHQVVSFAYASILPVKMVSFTTREEGKKVKLNWQTATETDNDYFTVERSTNQDNWTAIKKVKGAGNSTDLNSYEATDDSPVSGTSYYRIRQTDFNGNTTFSETRSVRIESHRGSVSVFPVPNTGNRITLNGINEYRNQELSVINAAGAMVHTTGLTNATVELPAMSKGVYFLRIKNKSTGEATTLRYVKI